MRFVSCSKCIIENDTVGGRIVPVGLQGRYLRSSRRAVNPGPVQSCFIFEIEIVDLHLEMFICLPNQAKIGAAVRTLSNACQIDVRGVITTGIGVTRPDSSP